MSYGVSAALQAAVYQHLRADAGIIAHVGSDIFDAVPTGILPLAYISLGPEDAFARNDKAGIGSLHRFTVSVVSDGAGFLAAKTIAGAVSDALHDAAPPLSRGRIVRMQFLRASARRIGEGARRRIDLTFEAQVEDE